MQTSQFNLEHESHSTTFKINFSLITSQFDVIWVEDEDSNKTAVKGNDKFSHSRQWRYLKEKVPTPLFLISPTNVDEWLSARYNRFKTAVPTE